MHGQENRSGPPSGAGFTAQRQFLARHQVTGAPLYSYKLSNEDFQELQALVAQRVQRTGIVHFDRHEAAAFCLYGAEWWRRNFSGGAWSWENLLRPIGAELAGSVAALYPMVQKGLLHWGRRVLSTRSRNIFLMTLAIEGGLPLNLIQRNGLWLRRYFRRLMEQHRDYGQICGAVELARELAPMLPVSLRHEEIYGLAGALVTKVWELQAQLGETKTPIEDLHTHHPGWERELPLQVADEVARTLFLGLIRDAAEVRAGHAVRLRVRTWLEQKGQGCSLYRSVDLPPRIELGQLRALLGQAGSALELPARLYLGAWDACEASWPVALLSRVFEQESYVVESARTDRELRLTAEGHLGLRLHVGTTVYGELQVPGGEVLSELPWIFAASEQGEPVRLLAEGGTSTRREEVLVAVPAGWTLAPGEGESCQEAGVLAGDQGAQERRLWRLRGAWTASGGGVSCGIRTGVMEAVGYQYMLRGRTLPGVADAVYLGTPQLWRCADDGPWQRVPPGEVVALASCGEVRLQHRTGGDVRYQARVRVLPAQAQVAVHPVKEGEGRIEIARMATNRITVEPIAGVQCRSIYEPGQDRHVLHFQAAGVPPPEVTLLIGWGSQQPMRLRLPYPAAGAWFVDREGVVLADEAQVAVSALPGIKLTALSPSGDIVIQAAMDVRDAGDLRPDLRSRRVVLGPLQSDGQRLVQSLTPLQEGLQPYFAATIEHDTPVVLTAEVSGRELRRLRVLRHAGRVKRVSDEPRRFEVQRNDGAKISTPCKVITLPLWEPAQVSELTLEGEMYAPPADRAEGPWLVMALNGDYYRPCLDGVPAAKGYTLEPGDGPLTLRVVSCQDDSRQRRPLFARWYEQLVNAPADAQWQQVLASLKHLHHAPAQWFDQVRALAENPDAVALAGLYLEAADFGAFYKGLESLPFSFASMPVAAWVRASRAAAQTLRAAGMEGEILAGAMQDCLRNLVDLAPRSLRGLRAVAELAQYEVLGASPPQAAEAIWKTESARLTAASQELFRGHSHDHWPHWSGWQEEVNRLVQVVPEQLRMIFSGIQGAAQVGYRIPVMIAPAIAAVASAWGTALPRRAIFYIKVLGQFDSEWFGMAHEIMLKLCTAMLFKTHRGQLGLLRRA